MFHHVTYLHRAAVGSVLALDKHADEPAQGQRAGSHPRGSLAAVEGKHGLDGHGAREHVLGEGGQGGRGPDPDVSENGTVAHEGPIGGEQN